MRRPFRLALIISIVLVCSVGYILFLRTDEVSDISADLRSRLDESGSQLYFEDLESASNWSSVCVVLPYADAQLAKNAPEILRRTSWVGSWDESEWRLVFLNSEEIVLVTAISYDAVKIVERDPSGIACVPRDQHPYLRLVEHTLKYEVGIGRE